jgi:hypothetical protein
MDPIDLLRFLLDPTRLAVVGALASASDHTEGLAERSGCSHDEVLRTLGVLVQAGLVTRDGKHYHLDVDAWREVARDLPQAAAASPRVGFGMTDEESQVLARFFRGDRLEEVPAQRSKRRIVLERLALELEPGVRYSEAEINELLRRFHDDHATLRRLLVDEGLVDRAAGEYWRAGGRVL